MGINAGIFGDGVNFKERFITDYEKLAKLVSYWKDQGLKIVLTSGAFDIFHIGHAEYLKKAKEMGDLLIVGIDSDEKLKIRKGPNRPIVPEMERASILAHLRHVDVIVLKNHDHPKYHLIKTIRPDILILSKSSKHKEESIKEREEFCGKVVILEPQAETSTTGRIRLLHIMGINGFASDLSNDIIKLINDKLVAVRGGQK